MKEYLSWSFPNSVIAQCSCLAIQAPTFLLLAFQVFQGNFDNDTHRKNVIDPPIYARHIRIIPWSWYGRITLRSELLGCTEQD